MTSRLLTFHLFGPLIFSPSPRPHITLPKFGSLHFEIIGGPGSFFRNPSSKWDRAYKVHVPCASCQSHIFERKFWNSSACGFHFANGMGWSNPYIRLFRNESVRVHRTRTNYKPPQKPAPIKNINVKQN